MEVKLLIDIVEDLEKKLEEFKYKFLMFKSIIWKEVKQTKNRKISFFRVIKQLELLKKSYGLKLF